MDVRAVTETDAGTASVGKLGPAGQKAEVGVMELSVLLCHHTTAHLGVAQVEVILAEKESPERFSVPAGQPFLHQISSTTSG